MTSPTRLLRIVSTDFLRCVCFASIYASTAAKSCILNYTWTAANLRTWFVSSGLLWTSLFWTNTCCFNPGGQPALHFGGGQFSWNFIRWRQRAYSTMVQLFPKRSHIIIMYFARRHEVHSVQTHTFCTTLVNKNRQNRTFYNSVGGWITVVKRNFKLHAICACTEQHSNILNTLRKLMIRA